MADPILIPIPDLPPVPGSWDPTWQLAIADPTTKNAYRVPGGDFIDKAVEQGAFADIRNTKFYVVGRGNPGDPAPGDSTIEDNTLQGYTFSSVVLRSFGPLIPGDEYLWDGVDTITINSLDPDNPGLYQFNNGDVIIVTFEPKISSVVAAPGSIGKGYAGVKRHTDSGNILPDDFQKLQMVVATSAPVNLTLPPGDDYFPGVRLTIVTNMVNTYQSIISAAGSDMIFLTPDGTGEVTLGFDEQVTLVWDDDGAGTKGWYVDYISPSYKEVGKWFLSYLPVINSVLFDGGTISKIQYPRAGSMIAKLQEIYLDAVVDFDTWNSDPFLHRTKWAAEDGSDIIIKPDWRGLFPRVLPGERADIDIDRGSNKNLVGSFEDSAMKKHNHVTDSRFNKLVARASDLDGSGTTGSVDSRDPDKEIRVAYLSGPGYDLWVNATIKMEGDSDYENRSINGGLYAYGCI